jgi:hypothetical protein
VPFAKPLSTPDGNPGRDPDAAADADVADVDITEAEAAVAPMMAWTLNDSEDTAETAVKFVLLAVPPSEPTVAPIEPEPPMMWNDHTIT